MNDFEPVDINFLINSPQVKEDAAEVKKEITGVALTAESVAVTTSKRIKETVEKSQKDTDAALEKTKQKYSEMADEAASSFDKIAPGVANQLSRLIELEQEVNRLTQAEKQLANQYDRGVIDQDHFARSAVGLRDKLLAAKQEMKAITAEISKQGQPIAQQKAQWNGLGNSISQIGRELPAFTYSAQTGFMAVSNNIPILVDEINRLRVANQVAAASGAATIPVWTAIKAAIFSWGTAITLIITLVTVFGKEIGGWIKGLFTASEALDSVARSQEAMSEAFKSTDMQSAISDITDLRTNLNLAKQGLIDQKTVIEQYNETIGKASKEVKTLVEVEQGLIDNADNYVQASLYKAAADAAREKVAKDMLELAEKQMKAEDDLIKAKEKEAQAGKYNFETGRGVASSLQQAKSERLAIEKEVAEGNKAIEELNSQGSKLIQSLKKQSLGFGLDLFSGESEFNKITGDIKKLNEQYATAGLERAEKEVETVKAKFAKLRAEADKFNADPKNKANLIDVAGLDAAEQKAIADIQAKQRRDQGAKVSTEHQQLLDKIAALDAEYARKSFTKDEEELQALRDKFGKVRELVERFNADPKNKAQRIDLTGLGEIENNAVGDLKFRQETAILAKEMAEQKRMFNEFETYKVQFGEAKAKERFGKELKGYETYLDYLKDLKDKADQEADVASATGSGGGPQNERAEMLRKSMEIEGNELTKGLMELAKKYQDFEQKQLVDLENYLRDRAKLQTTKTAEELAVMDQNFAEKQTKEKESQAKSLQGYKDLFASIERLSDVQVREILANAQKMLEGLDPTQYGDLIAQIKAKMADTELALENRDLGRIDDAAQAFGAMAQEIGGANTGLGAMLGILGNILAASASIKANIGNFKDAIGNYKATKQDENAGGLAKVGSVAGVVGAVVGVLSAVGSVVNSVIGYFKNLKKAKEEAQKAMEDFYQTARSGELEYEKLVRERELDSAARGKNSYRAILAQLELLKNQAPAIQEAYDKVFAALQGGQFSEDKEYQHGTWIRKAKTWDVLASLAGSDYERLEKLYMEGKLTDAAKRDFEALKELREELEATGLSVEELQAQLNEMLTGTNASQLSDGLTDLFKNGKMAAQDFGDSFEEIMRNAIVNSFRYKYLEEAMQPFYENLAAIMTEGTPTEDQIAALKEQYTSIGQNAADTWKMLEEATGMNLSGSDTSKQSGLSKGIERITSEQAGELAGLGRSTFDLAKRQYQLLDTWYVQEQKHHENSLNSYRTLVMIEQNTANTVEQLELAVVELKNVNKNLKSDGGFRDGGDG